VAKWFFFRLAVFGNFSTPKTKSGFGIKVWHWIDLSAGTGFWSLLLSLIFRPIFIFMDFTARLMPFSAKTTLGYVDKSNRKVKHSHNGRFATF